MACGSAERVRRICDGSLFLTSGGVNPSLTIQALACRIGDRIREMGRRGEL